MTEKVKVTKEQAEAIEKAITEFGKDRVIDGVLGKWQGELSPLNDLKPSEFARIMYDAGYEVEPEFKVGDWVAFHNRKDEIAIRQIKRIDNLYEVGLWACWKEGSMPIKEIRHATPSEIAEEKERRWWKKHGREPWELKKGDVIIGHYTKYIHVISKDSDESGYYIEGYHCDAKEIKHNFKILTFAENRLDVKTND